MLTVGVFVGANDPKSQERPYSWISVNDELKLSPNQLVEVENKLLFFQKYVAFERSRANGQTSASSQTEGCLPSRPPVTVKESDKERKAHQIEQCLESTVKQISSGGLVAWLDADKRRKFKMQSSLAKSLLKTVEGAHDLKPITGPQKEQVRNRNETMLRLLYEHFGLAHALLVIYSFSTPTLEGFNFQEIIHILRCFIRKGGYFFCGALEAEAANILSSEFALE
jgi:hypothetical protein